MDRIRSVSTTGLVCGIILCMIVTAHAEAVPQVEVRFDKNSALIGEKIRYTLRIRADKDTEIELPDKQQTLGGFNVTDYGTARHIWFGRQKISTWYLLQSFQTGKQSIPPLVIRYRSAGAGRWQEIKTEEKVIEIQSLLEKAGSGAQLRDIKGPLAHRARIIPFVIIVILSGVIAIAVLMRRKRRPGFAPEPLIGAHEIACRELEELKNRNLIKAGKIKEYFIAVSAIVRRYLENRFNLHAPEMTTEEFLVSVKEASPLQQEHRLLLREFLSCCDLVKFARYAPSTEEIQAVFDAARRFVDQTREGAAQEQTGSNMPETGARA